MNTNNTVLIGNALKWRNVFDINKQYYQENIVTTHGCVFRCKALSCKGKTPVVELDESGHIAYTNTDVWDVIVDMAFFYNNAIDTGAMVESAFDQLALLNVQMEAHKKVIDAMSKQIYKEHAEITKKLDDLIDRINDLGSGRPSTSLFPIAPPDIARIFGNDVILPYNPDDFDKPVSSDDVRTITNQEIADLFGNAIINPEPPVNPDDQAPDDAIPITIMELEELASASVGNDCGLKDDCGHYDNNFSDDTIRISELNKLALGL